MPINLTGVRINQSDHYVTVDAESLSSAELENFMCRKLPGPLREHGDFRYQIMGIMADVFAPKDGFERALDELKKLREDSNQRFEEMNR